MGKKNNLLRPPSFIMTLTMLRMREEVEQLNQRHKEVCQMAARSILRALDLKDHYTYGHSVRVTYLCLTLGKHLEFSEEELYELELAALFHDIGKIGTPDAILLKPTRLDKKEYNVMMEHPVKSAEILNNFSDFNKIAIYAKHHHERFDGRGYPDGLKSDNIPYFSRMILIADTFDAMTSSRPYRKSLSDQVAFDELNKFSGIQFDPDLVTEFISAMKNEENKEEETFELSVMNKTFSKKAA